VNVLQGIAARCQQAIRVRSCGISRPIGPAVTWHDGGQQARLALDCPSLLH